MRVSECKRECECECERGLGECECEREGASDAECVRCWLLPGCAQRLVWCAEKTDADVGRSPSCPLTDSWVGYPTLLYWVVGTGGQRCGGGGARGRRDRVWRQVLAVLLLVALLFGVGGFHGRRLDA